MHLNACLTIRAGVLHRLACIAQFNTCLQLPVLLPRTQEYSFETLPAGKSYPLRLGLIADTGQTYNSSTTYERLKEDRPQVPGWGQLQ